MAKLTAVKVLDSAPTTPEAPAKVLVRVAQLYRGFDLIGSKSTITARDADMEVTPIGIKTKSKKTGRVLIIPWANIMGCELL